MTETITNDRAIAGGLALRGFAPILDPNWNSWMDQNLLRLSVLSQGSVISRDAPVPANPPDGAIFIVPDDDDTNPNEIAVQDGGSLTFIEPFPGLQLFVTLDNQFVAWNGSGWVVTFDLNGGGGGMTLLALADTPSTFADQAGRQLVVSPTEEEFVYRDIPYDIPIFTPGRPAPGAVIRILISRNMTIPENFAGSRAMAGFTATDDTVFTIQRSGAKIGTITFAAGTPGGIFEADAPGDINFAAGSSLEIVNPGTQDETIQDMSYTFVGRQL